MKLFSVVLLLVAQVTFAGITTPDNFNLRFEDSSIGSASIKDVAAGKIFKPTITILDGGKLYSNFISVELLVKVPSAAVGFLPKTERMRYAIPIEADGTLSPLNQRILNALEKVAAGEVTLKQIHSFDGESKVAGDFSYKVIAAVSVGN